MSELLDALVINRFEIYPSVDLDQMIKSKKSHLVPDDIIELIRRDDMSVVQRMISSNINLNSEIGNIGGLGGLPPIVYCFAGVSSSEVVKLRVFIALLSKNVNVNFQLTYNNKRCNFPRLCHQCYL
jgi:hypothetical protein